MGKEQEIWENFIYSKNFSIVVYKHTRGARHSSRVEAKNLALLSSRDGYLLELTGWTKGSQASEALERGREIGL